MFDSRTKTAAGLVAAPFVAGMRIAMGEDPAQVIRQTTAEITLGVAGAHALREQTQRLIGQATIKSLLDSVC